jgi:hypothetical protein
MLVIIHLIGVTYLLAITNTDACVFYAYGTLFDIIPVTRDYQGGRGDPWHLKK